MNKRGRPKKYKEEYVNIAYESCIRGGFTDIDLCAIFGIVESTLYKWKHEYPDFSESIKKAKEIYDIDRVENAFLKRALGVEYDEISTETDGEGSVIKIKKTNKVISPDTAAGFIWLKNRNPDRWRDKPEEIKANYTEKVAQAIEDLEIEVVE